MKLSALFSAQRIIKQVLDWFQESKDEAITDRMQDIFTTGVAQDINHGLPIPYPDPTRHDMTIIGIDSTLPALFGYPTLNPDGFHVLVDTGNAYANGERITISNATITYDPTAPSHTTNDGLGGFVSTPRSTGSFDIPLTATLYNYIYVGYLQICDDSLFTLNKITNAKQFYKRTDGYQFHIATSALVGQQDALNPDPLTYVFLGVVNLSGSNTALTANISQVDRQHFKTQLRRVGIETSNVSLTDRPSTYAIGQQELFLDDHIKAVGHGEISPTNPHGMALEDIGVPTLETVVSHRQLEHTNGIIGGTPSTPMPSGSSMFAQRIQVSPGNDFIQVQALISGEVALVNGLGFDSTDFGAPQNISFVSLPSGTYEVFFDSTTGLANVILTSSYDFSDKSKLDLCTVVWDASIPGDGNLGVPSDKRRFGTTNALQRWVTAGRPPQPFPGQFGYNTTINKLEYFNSLSWTALP